MSSKGKQIFHGNKGKVFAVWGRAPYFRNETFCLLGKREDLEEVKKEIKEISVPKEKDLLNQRLFIFQNLKGGKEFKVKNCRKQAAEWVKKTFLNDSEEMIIEDISDKTFLDG